MHMHIGETWNKKTIMQFNHTKAIPRKRGGNGNNTALVNGNIQTLKAAVPKHAAASQQILHGSPPSVLCSVNTIYYRKQGGMSMPFLPLS